MKEDKRILNNDDIKKILKFVLMDDKEFYTKLCSGISVEEYEEFCKEFPEAKEIDRSVLGRKHDV